MRKYSAILKNASLAIAAIVSSLLMASMPTASAATQSETMFTDGWQKGRTLRYVALGDSVAVGLGLPLAADASAEDIACGRSPQAYAATVATGIQKKLTKINMQLSTTQAACQGATVTNLAQPQQRGSVAIRPQLDKAFSAGTPALATLTVGANDVHWADFIGACFSAAQCDTPANTAALAAYIASLKAQLITALNDIHNQGGGLLPLVVVTGYYQPVSTQCINPNLSAAEVAWITDQTNQFNAALKSATQQAGWLTKFAPVDFTGHDICSADSWVQRPGVPGELAPFHPTARGQQAMGEAVLKTLGLE